MRNAIHMTLGGLRYLVLLGLAAGILGVFKVDNVRVNIRELVREAAPKNPRPAYEAPPKAGNDTSHAPTRAAEDA
jgi:hypothetical protein